MLTQKLTRGIALTATIALLAGCPAGNPTGTPTPADTSSPVASASAAAPSAAATATPAAAASSAAPSAAASSAAPSAAASASAAATQSTKPVNDTGTTSDIKERATFNGKVYDPNSNPVDGATVTAKAVDAGVTWVGEATQTTGGAYVFRNAPVGARIEISVTKDGWTTRTRSEVLKSNLNGDPKANTFDFGFDGSSTSTDANALYAIQDEPEVTSLKINGKLATDTASGYANKMASPGNADVGAGGNILSASTTGVSTDSLTVEMTFSEAVNKDDVQNYFRILSTVGDSVNANGAFTSTLTKQTQITIDRTYPTVTFDWTADGKSVTVKTNKGILANVDGAANEARYLVDFSSQIRDLTAVKSNPNRTFRFSASKLGGFHVFSVKNQDQAPYITDFYAVNGASGSDYLKIKFSRPMDVVGRTALAAVLSDPTQIPPIVANNLKYLSVGGNNQSTTLGFNKAIGGAYVPVYQVAIVNPSAATVSTALKPASPNTLLVKSAVVDSNNSNTVIIELDQDAFNAGDKVVLSAGGALSGMYTGSTVNNLTSLDLKNTVMLPSAATFADLTDPAGKVLDRGNSTTSASFPISNSQKVATAG